MPMDMLNNITRELYIFDMFDAICRMVELIAVQLLQTTNAYGHVEQHYQGALHLNITHKR